MTIALLGKVGARLRAKLGLSEEAFPLAKALEGGTWAAGRRPPPAAAWRGKSGPMAARR